MKIHLFLLTGGLSLYSQQDPEKIRAAMRISLDQQKNSVQRQVFNAQAAPSGGFFTIAWPGPPPAVALPGTRACEPMVEPELAKLISDAAVREDIKPEVIRAMVRHESAGKPCSVSVKGAQGLMQIMPATAQELGLSDPFDPKQNIDAGTKFLKQLLTRYAGNLELALSAYNAGSGRVDDRIPEIAETKEYVRSIMSDLKFE